jgi:predicted transcriptional regulator
MEEDIINTIESLTSRANTKEDEANKLKKLVNQLCAEAGIPIRYPTITESGSVASIRSDQFYGLPLTASIRNYLEIRKASGLGAASVAEIYRAIKEGGYKFDTKNDDNARIGVGNALRKTSSIFHRLPNGQYGLLSWYPSAKAPPESDGAGSSRSKGKRIPKKKASGPEAANSVTNEQARDVILAQTGNFQSSDIEQSIKAAHPGKSIAESKISTVLFILKKKGLVKEISPRIGRKGATYARA